MSTYTATVVKVKMEKHPDASRMSIMHLEAGNVVCLAKKDWLDGDLAIHIEPDFKVNVKHPAFAWLTDDVQAEWVKTKPATLRGVVSYGFLVPLTHWPAFVVAPGDNAYNLLHDAGLIRRWEPKVEAVAGRAASGPSGVHAPKYDVENYFKYAKNFMAGEPIVATEKLHGQNGRMLWDGESFHCGARNQWKKEDPKDSIWAALENTPGLKDFLKENTGVVVYGEVYGGVRNYRYGLSKGKVKMAIFDLLLKTSTGPQWADWDVLKESRKRFPDIFVPIVFEGEYNLAKMKELSAGTTLMPDKHIREGVVVKPIKERTFGPNRNRLQVKFVGEEYLAGKSKPKGFKIPFYPNRREWFKAVFSLLKMFPRAMRKGR